MTKRWPIALVALSVAVQAVLLLHETRIGQSDLNDSVFHLAVAERTAAAFAGGNPLDFWVPEWAFGYPVLRTYQPLGSLLLATLYLVLGKSVSMTVLFAWVKFALLIAFPVTVWLAARMIGLSPAAAAAASLLAPWISTPLLYGIEYGSYLWRGSGLYSQLLAAHLFLLTIGFTARAFRGERVLTLTGVLAGATFLAHFIYGHMAALTIVLLAITAGGVARRHTRVLWIGSIALAVSAFQLYSLVRDSPFINRSRWEEAWKWDSFGAERVLRWLFTGDLLDHGRLPILTLLAAAGVIVAIRTGDRALRFASIAAAFWIVILFGRPTWGAALTALGFTDRVQLHRVIGGAHLFLLLVAGAGLVALWRYRIGALVSILLFIPVVKERLAYVADNKKWGEENLQWLAKDRPDLDRALAAAAKLPGRAYAGLGAQWGKTFRVGYVPVYAHLSRAHVPAVSYLYHAMSMTSEVMVLFDDTNPRHYALFNVGSVIAPIDRQMPAFLREVATFGRFRVLQFPGASYLSVVSELPRDVFSTPLDDAGTAFTTTVDVARDAHLLFKMTYHPNWRVTIDGLEQKPKMTAGGFSAVDIKRGRHHVAWEYRASLTRLALLAAGIVAAITAALLERRYAAVP